MRKLNTSDLFKAVRLLKLTGIQERVKPLLKKAADGNADVKDIGVDTIMTVICAFAEESAEKAVYDLLSGPFEMEPEEIASLDLDKLHDLIVQLQQDGGLQSFFGQLSGLIGTN